MTAKKLTGAALAAHNAKVNRESGSRARSPSARSTRSRASSVGSRKSTRSRRSGVVKDTGGYTASFNGSATWNPLNAEVHSFPTTKWHTKTAKAKVVNATIVPVTTDRCFAMVTAPQTQAASNASGPEVYIHNGTANFSILAAHPFVAANTPDSTEGVRRASAALEIIYTGRADEAAGYFTICGGHANSFFDTQIELDTVAEIASTASFLANHPDCIQIPVAAVAAAGSLVLVPKPISESAEKWHNTTFTVPMPYTLTDSEPGGWEQLFVICQGMTPSATFLVRWHQVIEAKCGIQSPFQNFVSSYKAPVANARQGEGLLQSFYRNMVESIGGKFSQYANDVGYALIDRASTAAMATLLRSAKLAPQM